MEPEQIRANIARWQQRLQEASGHFGGVEICAVTKTHAAAEVNCAADAGIRTIGENRVQELMGKIDGLDPRFRTHLIGQLQTNKVRTIIDRVDMIQSLDRPALAEEISRQAVRHGLSMPVLIQVNLAREPQKGGVYEEDLDALIRLAASLPGVHPQGLMAVMPATDDLEMIRPLFRQMRRLFEQYRDAAIPGTEFQTLSMGMSGDAELAAEEGATMVRLGSALFGKRM